MIPYSVAAATRPEILPYKEIPTPKYVEKVCSLKFSEISRIFVNLIKFLPKFFRWRIVNDEAEDQQKNLPAETKINNNNNKNTSQNGLNQDQQQKKQPEVEDISDETILVKHERALLEERRKFNSYLKFPLTSRSRANRIDSRGNESSGANTPDPTSPAPTIGADGEVSLLFLGLYYRKLKFSLFFSQFLHHQHLLLHWMARS